MGKHQPERFYPDSALRIYFKNGKAKVEIGLAKGKRQYEKRATIKEKEARREIERHLKNRKGSLIKRNR